MWQSGHARKTKLDLLALAVSVRSRFLIDERLRAVVLKQSLLCVLSLSSDLKVCEPAHGRLAGSAPQSAEPDSSRPGLAAAHARHSEGWLPFESYF